MKKGAWIFVNIISFGIPYAYAKHKAKKTADQINDKLITSKHVKFEISDLIQALGNKENITGVSATMSTLKVNVRSSETFTADNFKKFDVKGFMKNADQIILIFGDNANHICEQIKNILSL
ncbi:MAG: hypothetical protein LBM72_01305 [Mycoplasmataceae bacterium]|nr:hypothetical protein [Mycoplasmataceae bacterium]